MTRGTLRGMSDARDPTVGLIAAFAVGTLSAIAVGLLVYVIARAHSRSLMGVSLGAPQNFGVWPTSLQPSKLSSTMNLDDGTSMASRTDTVSLSTTQASNVFTAPMRGAMWRVRISVISPPGAAVALAIDSTPDPTGGRSVLVAAGAMTTLRIGPRQVIAGIALGADTLVSYVASAEVI